MSFPASNVQLRLAAVFLLLVFLPSALLGWFCLRAVESERRARAGRLQADHARYAEIAARTIHQQLAELEAGWQDLVPAPGGALLEWSAALDVERMRELYVRTAIVARTDGELVTVGATTLPRSSRTAPMPDGAEARIWEERTATAEDLEFDGRPEQALAAYAALEAALENPRLRAIAAVDAARAALAAQDWDAALASALRVRRDHPDAVDLDGLPLHLVARLTAARAHAGKGDGAAAAAELAALDGDLEHTATEISAAQYTWFRDQLSTAIDRTLPLLSEPQRQALAAQRATLAARSKPPAGEPFLWRKLERRLWRATTTGGRWSPRWRPLSDVSEGEPYLLAYTLLPSVGRPGVGGILGVAVDVPRLRTTLLPDVLRELELSEAVWIEIVDDAGQRVAGAEPEGTEPETEVAAAAAAAIGIGEPFEFWNVRVHAAAPRAALGDLDFRTRVWLYLVLVLLLAIAAGALLAGRELRREARLTHLKTSFVSNVSHELRTPLTSIRMYAELLESAGDRLPETERRRQLAVIRSESGRLERLIDAVLDVASLQRGTKKFEFEYEEVGELTRAVAEEFREQAEANGFRYTVEIEPDLPEARVDADAVRQVLLNLLSNAMKYSDADRSIAVRAFRRGHEIGIQVEDHGIGIDAADQERIFDDFYRVDQRLSTGRQGVGLGLTLVRRIVEAHRGRVTVESARGHGSRFTVWLPIEPAEESVPPDGRVPQEA